MARSRDTDLELNFDGLTDSLTNLVGTLILFVFLLFALTREIKPEVAPQVVPKLAWTEVGKKRPTADLIRELASMQGELAALDGLVKQQESQAASLRERIDDLSRRAKTKATGPTATGN